LSVTRVTPSRSPDSRSTLMSASFGIPADDKVRRYAKFRLCQAVENKCQQQRISILILHFESGKIQLARILTHRAHDMSEGHHVIISECVLGRATRGVCQQVSRSQEVCQESSVELAIQYSRVNLQNTDTAID
jgi:hypothetical protein